MTVFLRLQQLTVLSEAITAISLKLRLPGEMFPHLDLTTVAGRVVPEGFFLPQPRAQVGTQLLYQGQQWLGRKLAKMSWPGFKGTFLSYQN